MFSWLRPTATCPLDAAAHEWTEQRMRWLIDQFGLERLRAATVVLPSPQFFPDRFDNTVDGAYPMFKRICEYMGIPRCDVKLHFYEEEQQFVTEGTMSGTAGLYVGAKKPFQIWIEVSNLQDPLALAATMAHELAHVHLLGYGRITTQVADHEPLTDLLTVFLGLGVIASNAVLQQNNWQEGLRLRWSLRRSGYLTMPVFGYALALFAHARGETSPAWGNELRGDVRAPFRQGLRYLSGDGRDWRSHLG